LGNLKGRATRRPKHRREDNIRVDLREIGWGNCGQHTSGVGWGLVASRCEHGNETSDSIKG